ncbi:hypothetical protein CF327_g1607 [Tilletia walkeri]|uniref:AB hydrolase-1 domain-containing protein n=1 Tax=Tilletia walkeri TaxID=117179 RepID=A0A8X7T471_9BASI|nr:hypothetical protein CF327_g1607 [Tilletia walkeri]KAE8267824.1 hypothetical protein A4X09_0g4521 [Tilletia walkeri]
MRITSSFVALLGSSLLFAHTAGAQATKCQTPATTVQGSVRPYASVGLPNVAHTPAFGWTRLPAGNTEICLANLLRNEKIFPGNNKLTVPIYESNDVDRSQVTRVVLGVQALGADGWHYWTNLANTRNKAWGNNAAFDKSKVSIVLPQFLRQADKDAGAAIDSDIWWNPDTYGYGGSAVGPTSLGSSGISTLDVLDSTIAWIEARYPKVQRIVLVGHSLGGQLLQRYGLLRHDGQSTRSRLDFIIMNAATYAYPVKARPVPFNASSCPTFDTWPFGFASPSSLPPYSAADYGRLGTKGLHTRFATRNVHIALGSNDLGSGTKLCESLAEGNYHLSRGRFYTAALINATGGAAAYTAAGGNNRFKSSVGRGQAGLPAPWTYDIISGCSHSQECMYQSKTGIQRIMLDGFSATASRKRASRLDTLLGLDQDED